MLFVVLFVLINTFEAPLHFTSEMFWLLDAMMASIHDNCWTVDILSGRFHFKTSQINEQFRLYKAVVEGQKAA